MKLQQHPLSAAYPAMPQDEFDALCADVKAHGQVERGMLLDGMVLDGWHRYQACEAAGIAFAADELSETTDPVAFVRSKNRHRRHLTASQYAAIEIKLHEWRTRGGDQSAPGALRSTDAEIAAAAGVSERTVEQAKAAERAGLGDAVRQGKVSAKRAAEIAKLPEPERQAAVNEPAERVAPKQAAPKLASVDRLQGQVEELTQKLAAAREAADDAGALAQDLTAIADGDAAKRMAQLEAELKAVKAVRDQYLRENQQLKQQIKYLERKLGKVA